MFFCIFSAHHHDALIAETALKRGLDLITDDQDLSSVFTKLGGRVLNLRKNC